MGSENKNGKVPLISKIAYGFGDVGCNFSWMFVSNFLMIFYTEDVYKRQGFWKFWSIHRKNVSRHVRILESVADALIRICRMKSRWR